MDKALAIWDNISHSWTVWLCVIALSIGVSISWQYWQNRGVSSSRPCSFVYLIGTVLDSHIWWDHVILQNTLHASARTNGTRGVDASVCRGTCTHQTTVTGSLNRAPIEPT